MIGLDNLRAALTMLVVAHHASLAYFAYASSAQNDTALTPSLIVDNPQSFAALYFVNLNDTFFMPLMFLLSGMFVPASLARRTPRAFMANRALRLGVPLAAMTVFVVPVALLAAARASGRRTGWWEFWRSLFSAGGFPVGPGWFLSLLLVFNAVAAHPRILGTPVARAVAAKLGTRLARPGHLLAALAVLSAAGYAPLLLMFGPNAWVGLGPIVVQASRPLLYAAYFAIGAAQGAGEKALGGQGTSLAQLPAQWFRFACAAVPAAVLLLHAPGEADNGPSWPSIGRTLIQGGAQIAFSALMAVGLIGAALRFGRAGSRFPAGLRSNAYGIYVLHYAPVLWLQYGLRTLAVPGLLKAVIVFLGALASAWGLSSALRRIPAVAAIL